MNKKIFKKIGFVFLTIIVTFSFTFLSPKLVKAQALVSDPGTWAGQALQWITDKAADAFKYAYDRGGALAFQQALRSALNKIAIDSATWIASGDKGQKPLFITEGTREYFTNIADEAAGEFIEDFVNNWNITQQDDYRDGISNCDSISEQCVSGCDFYTYTYDGDYYDECLNECVVEYNKCLGDFAATSPGSSARPVAVCQPSSIDVKLGISLALTEHTRPRAPTCTASALVRNWSDEISRLDPRTWDDRDYLNRLSGIFHPTQSDIGIALTVQSDLERAQAEKTITAERDWMESGRWLDVVGISGRVESLPGQAGMEAEIAQEGRMSAFLAHSGDAFVDAANIFLNTLALQYYNRLMQSFGKEVDDMTTTAHDVTDPDIDPSVSYSNVSIEERITEVLGPAFSQKADYNIASDLALCPDPENPGPTECVIDFNFVQAINERMTVVQAVNNGLLRGSWQLTPDLEMSKDDAYTLRNISILRKHRILPVGWEIAAKLNEDKKVTLQDLISCFDPNDDYNEFSPAFDRRNAAWCEGLVDPHWVLKSPLSFCRKEGVGEQIINKQVMDGQIGMPNVPDNPSVLSVTRADGYCADELTCIKEDEGSGDCLVYGYCNEEKRIWSFEHSSCNPVYNTCTAFTHPSGDRVAYLENTLDYGICSEDNAGCLEYYLRGSFDTSNQQINWDTSPNAYFTNNLETCSSQNEGCTELMRVRSAWGKNLIMGANFENDELVEEINQGEIINGKLNNYWPIIGGLAAIVDGQNVGLPGTKVMMIEGDGIISDGQNSLLPDNFFAIPGQTYTFSADVFLESGSGIRLVIGDDDNYTETSTTGNWQRLSQTYHLDSDFPQFTDLSFSIQGQGGGVVMYLRNLQFEVSPWENSYSPYGNFKIYQRLIPQYLENVCYEDASIATPDYRLRDNAPSICYNFARQCNRDEVGCIMLTSQKNNISVPAQPATTDYCPRECEAYDSYVAQSSHFFNSHLENLIPYSSQVCSANAAGCTEFTNLDDIPSGGELREYYTHLKHCIKPNDTCGNFYIWESDGEDGHQLRILSLKSDGEHPALTSDDDSCSEDIYNLPSWHPNFNPDCRQFYNQAGMISYNSMTKTITCSDDCHRYRMTELNYDPDLTQVECSGNDRNWANDRCYVCKNNGQWSNEHNSCLYQGIPGEGKTCSANMAGCREYSGSDGSNVRLIYSSNFLGGSGDWEGYCGQGAALSNNSVSQNGQSLWYQDNPVEMCDHDNHNPGISSLDLSNQLNQGASYSIQILARARQENANVSFSFTNTDDELESIEFYPDTVEIRADQWQIYEFNLPIFNRSIADDEGLFIAADNDFYIDNIVVNEVSGRYYLISDSSDIPDICYYDVFDNYRGGDYNLGCSRWIDDNSGTAHFLRKISSLCQESSVGCEMMIDTANYSNWQSEEICDSVTTCIEEEFSGQKNCYTEIGDCVDVPDDRVIAAVYDRTKVCSSDNMGCTQMGQIVGEGPNRSISSVYRKNNPDNYSNSLCSEEEVGCQEWGTDFGYQYFKDPRNDACVYRQSSDPDIFDRHWFQKSVKRCQLGDDDFGAICSSDDDCPDDINCVLDESDYPCSVSYFETIGTGGLLGRVPTPDNKAGICNLDNSGCTEYIDPVSQFSSNLILPFNWQGGIQEIRLIPNTLYLFTVNKEGESASIEFSRDVRVFDFNSNQFEDDIVLPGETLDVSYGERVYFHSQLNSVDDFDLVSVTGSGDSQVVVRPLIVNYQLIQNVDYQSCDGLVNFDRGCVLFNERSFNGASGLSQLNFNAFASELNRPPVNCLGDNCNANKLIKVTPDRTCERWLDCSTYAIDPDTGEKTCYDLGECTHLNENQECANFMSFKDADGQPLVLDYNQINIHNISGYSLLDRYFIGEMGEVGLNSQFHFDFEHFNQALHCRRDINTDFPGFPNSTTDECAFNTNIVADSLIIEPRKATTDYPAQGRGYLKVLAYHQMSPHSVNSTYSLKANEDYYLHYLLNTKDSGLNARVLLVDQSSEDDSYQVVWQGTASANQGWERKIHKFNLNDDYTSLKLYLTADTNNLEERYVYFDDIHIEPVLKVGPDEYVAKDCRLYPDTNSLSCISQNDEIISHGLEGYCLERDLLNFENCLTWYPVDEISSSQLNSKKKLGYQGPQPLYYCVEANANFEILEKRVANFVGVASQRKESTGFFGNLFGGDGYWTTGDGGIHFTQIGGWMASYTTDTTKYGVYLSGDCMEVGHSNNKMVDLMCGGDDNYVLVAGRHIRDRTWPNADFLVSEFFCIPKSEGVEGVVLKSDWKSIHTQKGECHIEYRDVWAKFDGFTSHAEGTAYYKDALGGGFSVSCKDDSLRYIEYDYSDLEICRDRRLNEATNHDPPLAIFDYNNPPRREEDLKYIAHDNLDKVYELTCNRFVEVVDATGVNKAWTGRVSPSAEAQLTPNFMAQVVADSPFFLGGGGGGAQLGSCSWAGPHPLQCSPDYSCLPPCDSEFEYQDQTYSTNLIANQCWITDNFNTSSGKTCYNNSSSNCNNYGGLYNWDNAMGACPPHWRLPNDNEVQALKDMAESLDLDYGYCAWKSPHPDTTNYCNTQAWIDDEYGNGCEDYIEYCVENETEDGLDIWCQGVDQDYCSDISTERACENNDYCDWISSDPNPLMSCRQEDSILANLGITGCDTSSHPRWNSSEDVHGTNNYGFSALPSGAEINGNFIGLGNSFYFWTSNSSGDTASNWYINLDDNSLNSDDGVISKFSNADKSNKFSVRCVRDSSSEECTYNPNTAQWNPPGCCQWDETEEEGFNYLLFDGCAEDYPYCIENETHSGNVHCGGIDVNYCSRANTAGTCDPVYCQFTPHGTENHFWIRYGRLREEVPFGAAVLPENFDFYTSSVIKLRNQYSDRNNQEIFAGRPYGCSGVSCENIGQCSANPNVYCIFEPDSSKDGHDRINYDSCFKGGYGQCLQLWQGDYDELSADKNFFDHPLKSIFLRSFGGFEYNYDDNRFKQTSGYNVLNEDYYYEIPQCSGNVRSITSEWCAVYPSISNVRLVSVETGEIFDSSGGEANIPEDPGLYYLEFNSRVDLEQQPLNRIEINWGDGSSQVIINQDHKPERDKPHRFYHFYSNLSNIDTDFNITIYDNWDFYGTINGSGPNGYSDCNPGQIQTSFLCIDNNGDDCFEERECSGDGTWGSWFNYCDCPDSETPDSETIEVTINFDIADNAANEDLIEVCFIDIDEESNCVTLTNNKIELERNSSYSMKAIPGADNTILAPYARFDGWGHTSNNPYWLNNVTEDKEFSVFFKCHVSGGESLPCEDGENGENGFIPE